MSKGRWKERRPGSPRVSHGSIEQGVPIPPTWTAILRLMRDGDSFYFEGVPINEMRMIAYSLLRKKDADPDAKFIVRREGIGGRIWRTTKSSRALWEADLLKEVKDEQKKISEARSKGPNS